MEFPVARNIPPQEPEYQNHPEPFPRMPPEILIVVEEPGQTVEGFAKSEAGPIEVVAVFNSKELHVENETPDSCLT